MRIIKKIKGRSAISMPVCEQYHAYPSPAPTSAQTYQQLTVVVLTLLLPWVIKTELLFTISMQYQPDKWWE